MTLMTTEAIPPVLLQGCHQAAALEKGAGHPALHPRPHFQQPYSTYSCSVHSCSNLADTAQNVNSRCQKSTSAEIFNHVFKWGLGSPFHGNKFSKQHGVVKTELLLQLHLWASPAWLLASCMLLGRELTS